MDAYLTAAEPATGDDVLARKGLTSPTPPRLVSSSVDSAVFTGKPRPRAGSVVHDAARSFRVLGAEPRAGFATRGSSPNSGGSSSDNTAPACWWSPARGDGRAAASRAPCPADGRAARRSCDAFAGGGVGQHGDDRLGPVAPARHRPRRKQHAHLRARTAAPQRANGRSVRTGRSRSNPSAPAARRNLDRRSDQRPDPLPTAPLQQRTRHSTKARQRTTESLPDPTRERKGESVLRELPDAKNRCNPAQRLVITLSDAQTHARDQNR